MTVQTSTRNPAQAKLDALAREHRIEVFQAGDDEELCARCMVAIVPTRTGWVHDVEEIRQLRHIAAVGVWPK